MVKTFRIRFVSMADRDTTAKLIERLYRCMRPTKTKHHFLLAGFDPSHIVMASDSSRLENLTLTESRLRKLSIF